MSTTGTYHRTETGWPIIAVTVVICGLVIVQFWSARMRTSLEPAGLWLLTGFMICVTATVIGAFGWLRVRLVAGVLEWRFGVAGKKYTLAAGDVTATDVGDFGVAYGYGLRKISGGWLYRVNGTKAVIMTTATTRLAIGVSDPQRLIEALQSAIGPTATESKPLA